MEGVLLGWVGALFVCFKAACSFNEVVLRQIGDNPFLSV